jgi:hypothetical protein
VKDLMARLKASKLRCTCFVRKIGFGVHVPDGQGTCKLRGDQNQVRKVGSDVGITDEDLAFLKAQLGKPVF